MALTLRAALVVVGAFRMHTNASFLRSNFSRLAFAIAGTSAVTAQEALDTAIRGDRSEQARQLAAAPSDTAPERLRAGPVEFSVGLTYSFEYTDNVRNTSSPREEDYIQRPQLNIGALLPFTDSSRLTFGVGVGYSDYFRNNDLDRFHIAPDSELAYEFTVKDVAITLFDQFDYSYDVESVGEVSGVAQFPRYQNSVGFRAAWAPSEWSYQCGYSHNNFITVRGSSEDTDFTYLDRSAEQVFGRVSYSFAAATRVGVEVSGGVTDYSNPYQADNRNLSAGPFFNWQVTEAVAATLRGGVVNYDFDATALSTNPPVRPAIPARSLSSYYSGIGITHQLTEFIRHGISFDRSIRAGVNRGANYTENISVGYNIGWKTTDRLDLGLVVSYGHGVEPQTQVPDDGIIIPDELRLQDETFDTYRARLSASYQIVERIRATLMYSHSRRISTGGNRNYFVNRVSIGLGYRF